MQWGAASRLQRFWDLRAACNFIGGGTGCGLLLWAALGLIAGLPYFPAAGTGLVFVAAGLFMVWLEIGKPWRAFNLFFRPQTSWMTREGIVALPLFATGAIAVLFDADVRLALNLPSPVIPATLTALLGLTFLYCQLRLMRSAQGLPAWREPRAMPLLGVSGLTEGLGLYLLVTAILGSVPTLMVLVALALIIARAIAWRRYLSALSRSAAPKSTIEVLTAASAGFLTIGHVLPVIFLALGFVAPGLATPLTALAGIMAAIGGWYLKVILVTKAAYIPRFTIPAAPVRGQSG
ncbi:MAG: phenylacetyl-CoA:acceptor oxidoreductase [Gammaproteobacteria bacterium]